jgi:hypothetical protein
MRKKICLLLILISICFARSIYGCNIKYLNPSGVSPGDTVLIEIIADYVHCGNYSQAGFIEPIGADTLYFKEFQIINDTLAEVLIIGKHTVWYILPCLEISRHFKNC